MIAIFHFGAYAPKIPGWAFALIVGVLIALLDVVIRDLRESR